MKLPYWSVASSGTLPTLAVEQLDAEQVRGLRLEVGPGRHAAIAAFDQLAGRDRIAGRVEHILAQEDLMRGMRGVGLVLVDEGVVVLTGRSVSSAVPITPSCARAGQSWRGSAP